MNTHSNPDSLPLTPSRQRILLPVFPLTAAAGIAIGLLAGLSTSGAVVGSYEIVGHDLVKYSYRIDNQAGLFDIAAWSLDLNLAAPDWNPLDLASGGQVAVPDANWIGGPGIPVSGLWAQDFVSLSTDGDVGMGEELDGFWFFSRFLPGQVVYHEFSATGESATGVTIGPALPPPSVPEPGVWAAGAVVGGFAAATFHRRRSRGVTHA